MKTPRKHLLLGLFSVLLVQGFAAEAGMFSERIDAIESGKRGLRYPMDKPHAENKFEALCMDCHDGSVYDSRFVWDDNLSRHPVGIEVPEEMLPENLPLGPNNTIDCYTCHRPHPGKSVVEGDEGAEGTHFMRFDSKTNQFCFECHKELADEPDGHHPLDFELEEGEFPEDLGHGYTGTDNNFICQTCHAMHGARGKKAILAKPIAELCIGCHDNKKRGHGQGNRKTPDYGCVACHLPHDAPEDSLLASQESRENIVCLNCHEEKQNVKNSPHNLETSAPRLARGFNMCTNCHLPHNVARPFMSRLPVEPLPDGRLEACLACHSSDDGPGHKIELSRSHPQPWMEEIPTYGTGMELRSLNNRRATRNALIGCGTCHDPHQWDVADPDATMESNPHAKHLRKPMGDQSELCMTCHLWAKDVLKSDHNFAETMPDARVGHKGTAAQMGACLTCHDVHDALGATVLVGKRFVGEEEDPDDRLNPIENMCLSCHEDMEDGPTLEYTSHEGNPLEDMDPWYEDGGRYFLYDRNGGRTIGDGDLVCVTCHDPHVKTIDGKEVKKFLRPGTVWKLCIECHEDDSESYYKNFHFPDKRE